MGLRERKKLATRRRLEHEALSLVMERGLGNVTVDDIAAAANVSTRTFFNYFSTKEDALVGEGPPRPSQEARERFVAGGPTGELVDDLKVVLVSFAEEEPDEYRTILADLRLRRRLLEQEPQLIPRVMASFAAVERRIAETVADRLKDDPDDMRPQALAMLAAAVMRFTVQRADLAPGQDAVRLRQTIDEVFDVLRASFRPGPY